MKNGSAIMAYQLYNAKSQTHGNGLFATRKLNVGEEIWCDRDVVKRGFNHCCKPNAKLTGDGHITIILAVAKDEEVMVDYHFAHKLLNCNCPICRERYRSRR